MENKCMVKNKKHFGDLNDMRLAGQLCDVTIKVNGKEFQAHKIVLASNLKYFKSMFLNDGFLENKQSVVTMENLEEKYLELILTYAYTGECLLTDSNALGLLEIGNYLNEDFIKEKCINFLEKYLRKSDACPAYQFANAIECVPLKATARSRILSNFEYCSQTAEYFDFDCDSLKAILCDIRWYPQSQQSFFEGLIRWILHDVENRKIHVKDLVNLIDMSKLASDYMIKYFCRITKNQSDIASEIMIIYNDKIQKTTNQEEIQLNDSLMLVGLIGETLGVQFYDFTEQKWCQFRRIWHSDQFSLDRCTIFRNQLFYTVSKLDEPYTHDIHLQVFDFSTKQNTTLSSEKRLLSQSAMCASTDRIYFCGGETVDGDNVSDQVLKYDPRTNHFETLPPMWINRAGSAAIFYQGYILVLGGYHDEGALNSVEKYDPSTNQWMAFPSMLEPRYCFGVAILNGKLYACGGRQSHVEVYDPSIDSWRKISTISGIMRSSTTIAYEGKLYIVDVKLDEKLLAKTYDPSDDRWLVDENMSTVLQLDILGGGLVPSRYVN